MKNVIKLISLTLALVLGISLASCSLGKQYSYKTEDTELSIGAYIYEMYNAYKSAEQKAQATDVYDSETKKYDGKKSFLDVTIKDDDENEATASQYMLDTVDKSLRDYLAIYHEFEALGCVIDDETLQNYQTEGKNYWDMGPYYQYGEQYYNPLSAIYEPLGVSYDSFYQIAVYKTAMKDQLFKDYYGATAQNAVTDDQIKDFFKDNYTSYKYFSVPLYTTNEDASQVEGINDSSTTTALSEDEIQKYKDSFSSYADSINNGTAYDDAIKQYMSDFDVQSDPTSSNTEILDKSSIGEDLVNAIKELEAGKASYKVIGEGDNQTIYFFYKGNVEDEADEYLEDENNKDSVLHEMKDEDFDNHLKEVADSLDVQKSGAINNYSPKKMEKIVNDQEKSSSKDKQQ